MDDREVLLCKCHPDFHLPGDVTVGIEFDGLEYAKKAKASGVDSLVLFAKCHYGFSYYHTKIGTIHPGLVKDMMGEFVAGCKQEGLNATCYYSVFLDTAAVSKHPDWILRPSSVDADDMFAQKYLPVCVNSPYLDEMLIPQTLELLNNYEVDEIFFDTMADFIPCYCENCVRLFGKQIPGPQDEKWPEYVNWYNGQYQYFFDKILQTAHDVKPDVSIVINWKWSATLPETPVKHVKHLVGDLFTSGAVASYFSHYWAGTGYPFDYMCGRFLHGLGDWSNNTPETLKCAAASTIANGGSFYLIDRQLPDGSLEERSYAIMKDVFGFVQERRSIVVNTTHVPETAVLHSLENVVGPRNEYFPDGVERENRLRPLKAISGILIHHAKHYTAINTDVLKKRLSEYKLLILPEIDFLDADAMGMIRLFVENGGKLLVIQSGSDVPAGLDLLELAGAGYHGRSEIGYGYIAKQSAGIPDPVLVRGRFALVSPMNEARAMAPLIAPLRSGKGCMDFGHGFAPATLPDGHAAITSRKIGKGEVVYVSGPLLTSYFTHLSPHIAQLIIELYDYLLPDPLVRIDSPALLEMTAVRQKDDLIVHLVNHSGKETLAGGWMPITEFIPEIQNIGVSVKSSGYKGDGIYSHAGDKLNVSRETEYSRISLPSLKIMSSLRLQNYFQAKSEQGG
jgi:hypothetical protein